MICVGNLTLGGVGKTPLVEMLVKYFEESDKRVAVLTRGYADDLNSAGVKSDEVLMLKESFGEKFPILVGSNRFQQGMEYLSKGGETDVFLMDDGYQHIQLERDLNILVMDSTAPWGNGRLIPRGTLREPIESLQRADLIVLTKTDLSESRSEEIEQLLSRSQWNKSVVKSVHQPKEWVGVKTQAEFPVAYLKHKRIVAVSAIGNPDSFTRTLERVGCDVIHHFPFIDHYSFEEKDIQQIIQFCELNDVTALTTTHKNAMKLRKFSDLIPQHLEFLFLKIGVEITDGKDVFFKRIDSLLHR